MIGERIYIKELKIYSSRYITFGDGPRRKINGMAKLITSNFPYIEDVMLLEGLNANLIIICQLCDQGMIVNLYNDEFIATGLDNKTLMKGSKSKDHYYVWIRQ